MPELTLGDLVGRGQIRQLRRRLENDARRALHNEALKLSMFLHSARLLSGLEAYDGDVKDASVGSYEAVLRAIVEDPPDCERLREILAYLQETNEDN